MGGSEEGGGLGLLGRPAVSVCLQPAGVWFELGILHPSAAGLRKPPSLLTSQWTDADSPLNRCEASVLRGRDYLLVLFVHAYARISLPHVKHLRNYLCQFVYVHVCKRDPVSQISHGEGLSGVPLIISSRCALSCCSVMARDWISSTS